MPDPSSLPRPLPSAISLLVGDRTASRGLAAARAGRVDDLAWDAAEQTVRGTVTDEEGAAHRPSAVLVEYDEDAVSRRFQPAGPGGLWRPTVSRCDCPAQEACQHVAALLYHLGEVAAQAVLEQPVAEWRSVLRPVLSSAARPTGTAAPKPLALRVDLQAAPAAGASRRRRVPATAGLVREGAELWVGLRPMTRGSRGTWVKGQLSWRTFEQRAARRDLDETQAEALARVFAAAGVERSYAAGSIEHLWLGTITSPLLWQALAQARSHGVELLPGDGLASVELLGRAEAGLDLRADEHGDLQLRPLIDVEGEAAERGRLLGGAGVLDVLIDEEDALHARIAPLARAVPRELRTLLQRRKPLAVPTAEREAFLELAYPQLRTLTAITSSDDSVELPAARRPTLLLQAAYASGDRLTLRWSWRYHEPELSFPIDQRHGAHRDLAHEDAVIAAAMSVWPTVIDDSAELLSGPDTARFSEHALDALAALEHVDVQITGTRHAYRELDGAPQVRITQHESPGKNDWFDLGFDITIEGRQIPFPTLFVALAQGRSRLLLPDKTYFALDHPAFDALRELIAEGEALAEWEPETQRISRYQVDLWDDLAEVAQQATASAAWERGIAGVLAGDPPPAPPLPTHLTAELRDYQQEGFAWLAMLFAHELGGILADDMGLGKTVQTLALIAHARERVPSAPPFLVVAPASVLPVWRREAERFTPGLTVRVLDATAAARGTEVPAAIDGADLVVTSYTVLRIDQEAFAAAGPFQGLVLDEAQFVKNPRSRTHLAAAGIQARMRLAITGTPMENSLADLWAIADLVAPGLLGTAIGFRQRFTLPISSGEHPERLALLRRRIRPFLLRRTKEQVAAELPAKHQEVITVPLSPEHREVYDSVLQRERKKVLGLIESDVERARFIMFRSLTLLRMLALDPALVDAEAYADVPGSKLEALLDRLAEVIGDGHRVLLFSQFTSYLDLIGERLAREGIAHERLDGSTRDRDLVVTAFREGQAPVFLISLKAGGFGLTLTEADYVFLLDPWWNPAAENQAIDRTHRIGQDRPVMVYRMIAEDTIEQKVLALQQKKAELFDALTDGGEAFRAAITAEDLRELLG